MLVTLRIANQCGQMEFWELQSHNVEETRFEKAVSALQGRPDSEIHVLWIRTTLIVTAIVTESCKSKCASLLPPIIFL